MTSRCLADGQPSLEAKVRKPTRQCSVVHTSPPPLPPTVPHIRLDGPLDPSYAPCNTDSASCNTGSTSCDTDFAPATEQKLTWST